MHCPVCQASATETTPACEQCGFTLAALDQALGIPPSLKPDVSDLANEFTAKEMRQLQALSARLGRRFPQVRFVIVACRPPSNITLPLYAFWLFNRGGVSSAVEKGGANRVIMLMLDGERHRATSIIGYGLEPLLGEHHLAEALDTMRPHLVADEPVKAIEAFFENMAMQLESIAKTAALTYGLQGIEFQSLGTLLQPDEAPALAY